jgi:hypothetical protein
MVQVNIVSAKLLFFLLLVGKNIDLLHFLDFLQLCVLIFRDGGLTVAYCDVGATAVWDHTNGLQSPTHKDPLDLTSKEYILDVKPLFSAFQPKNLAMTSLRSFLLFYLPLLEPRTPTEEQHEDDVVEPVEPNKPVDLVTPFQNSIKQILREVSSVHYLYYSFCIF